MVCTLTPPHSQPLTPNPDFLLTFHASHISRTSRASHSLHSSARPYAFLLWASPK